MTPSAIAPGWLADQLPRPLAEDHFTRRLLRIFEDVGASVRMPVLSFAHNLDVGLAPMAYVQWMGRWLSLAVPLSLSEPRQRDLLATAGATWKRRGTRGGLARLLETITGGTVEIDDGGGVFGEGEAPPNQKKIVVDLAGLGGLEVDQIMDFVRLEIPANVSVELRVEGRAVETAAPEPSDDPSGRDETAGGDEATTPVDAADEPPPEDSP